MIRAVPHDWTPRGLGHRGPEPFEPFRPPPLAERLEARKMSLADNTGRRLSAAASTQNRDLVSVLDQTTTEACLPHTGAQLVRACHIRQGIAAPQFLSIALLWQQLRQLENTFPMNEGAYPSSLVTILSHVGYVESSLWPWSTDAARRAPRILDTDEFDQRADAATDWADVQDADDVARLVLSRHLCGWGGPVTNDFVHGNFDPSKAVGPAVSDIAGGHEMTIVWYDAVTDWFLMLNSWGPRFCLDGFCWVTRDFIESGHNRETILHAEPFPLRREAA